MVLIGLTLGLLVLLFLIMVALTRAFERNSGRRPHRLEADPLARGRGPERGRRRPADDRGAERATGAGAAPRRSPRRTSSARLARTRRCRARGRGPFSEDGDSRRLSELARALIVGCGCHGRELGAELLPAGWQVRGTSARAAGAGGDRGRRDRGRRWPTRTGRDGARALRRRRRGRLAARLGERRAGGDLGASTARAWSACWRSWSTPRCAGSSTRRRDRWPAETLAEGAADHRARRGEVADPGRPAHRGSR